MARAITLDPKLVVFVEICSDINRAKYNQIIACAIPVGGEFTWQIKLLAGMTDYILCVGTNQSLLVIYPHHQDRYLYLHCWISLTYHLPYPQ